jgi:hypothetical protein
MSPFSKRAEALCRVPRTTSVKSRKPAALTEPRNGNYVDHVGFNNQSRGTA